MSLVGPDVMFENHTVKEIQEIEKKLRNDIERKKEELRQMVGERYRDLMEAADTITEMKEIAGSVTNCVKSIEGRCLKLQNSSLQNNILYTIQDKVEDKRKANEILYVVASQIKILMDSPTKIWASIENKDFISSASLYLLARHTHSLLMLNPSYQDQRVMTQFPIIQRQWITISQFRNILMQDSQLVLETQETEPEDALGPLCCQCLLSNSSIKQMFLDFLSTRKNVLRSIFRPEKYAKTQVCEFAHVVQMTLNIIYILFYPVDGIAPDGCEKNLLYHSLTKLLNPKESGPVSLLDMKSTEVFKYLPNAIKDFRPILNSPLEPSSIEFLRLKCNDWLTEIKDEFQSELRDLLNFVNSIKNLSLIREALFDNLCKIQNWDVLCNNLLNKSFSIWDFFLKECFLQRVEIIIDEHIKTACEFSQKDIEETLYKVGYESTSSKLKYERNISLYVWSESQQDVIDNVAWLPRHHRNYWNSGELSMKSMGFTPKVQNICKDLDSRIKDALTDISHFSCLQKQIQIDPFNREREITFQNFITEVNRESGITYKYLVQAVENYFVDLLKFIEVTLSYLESEKETPEKSYRIVLLGHLCSGLSNLCPHVNIALSSEKSNNISDRNKHQEFRSSLSSAIIKENEQWKSLKNKLLETSASAFKLWSKDQIKNFISTIESDLTTGSSEGLLKILLQWDKIEIQEESEQGKSIKSVLRIPQHISTPVSNALFAFCCKLNSIGGFSVKSDVRSSISKDMLSGLLEIYRQKVTPSAEESSSRLLQIQSLQLLFDVQFLVGLMMHKENASDEINGMSQQIINEAISHIDPFDMDVFALPLQQNIKKALQKSLSLFGLLTSPDQVSYLNSFKSHSSSSQMDHNVMLTSGVGARFPLLPLPSRTNAVSSQEQLHSQPKESETKPIPTVNSSPNLSACDNQAIPLKSAASFYEKMTAMSSSWFGN